MQPFKDLFRKVCNKSLESLNNLLKVSTIIHFILETFLPENSNAIQMYLVINSLKIYNMKKKLF